MRWRILTAVLILQLVAGSLSAQKAPTLDPTTFVVLGEGLAAGMSSFGLSSTLQQVCFPALIAQQMNTAFPQALFEPPGIGVILGAPPQPVRVPSYPQTTVRIFPPQPDIYAETPTIYVLNLSVPGLTVADSISSQPVSPLVQDDMQQTTVNMILGFPALILGQNLPLWSQLQYAEAMMPTFTLVELGYYDVLSAAVAGDPTQIPAPSAFASSYTQIVKGLRSTFAQVLVTTIPNPLDTAYFMSPAQVAGLLHTSTSVILSTYNLQPGDFITRNGLTAINYQLMRANGSSSAPPSPSGGPSNPYGTLPSGSILPAAVAANISSQVAALNAQISSIASQNGAFTYDLNGFFHRIAVNGTNVGSTTITGQYLGGFYGLDGFYPGATGHALIANDILTMLNQTFNQSFQLVNVAATLQNDPAGSFLPIESPQVRRAPPRPRTQE